MQSINKSSFILRLWRVEHTEAAAWLASLEIPETGKRIGFASLEQLFVYLIDFTDRSCDKQPAERNGTEEHHE